MTAVIQKNKKLLMKKLLAADVLVAILMEERAS